MSLPQHRGGIGNNFGVYNNSSSPKMTNVTATASGGTSTYGIYNGASSPIMTNVTASASGGININYGVYNNSSSPIMTNVTASATGGTSYGMYNSATSGSYTILIDRCSFTGSTNSVLNDTEFTLKIGASKLNGSISGTGFTCAGSYNGSYVALGPDCLSAI